MPHGMSPIKPFIPTYTSHMSTRFSGNGQLPIARPWDSHPNPLMEPLVHPPNNKRLKRRWTFDEIH